MKVEIVRVLDAATQLVVFRSDVGTAAGIWAGTEPATPGPTHVELDVPDDVDEYAVVDSETPDSIAGGIEPGTGVHVVGKVVQVGEDGDTVVSMRVGTEILMVDASGQRSDIEPDNTIRFTVSRISLYPYDL